MLDTECPVDLLCFSHLRWDHVYQRPNHLMSRAAAAYRVWFVEEPVEAGSGERIEVDEVAPGVRRVRFVVPCAATDAATAPLLRRLMDQFLHDRRIGRPILWYYSPLALAYSEHVEARAVV